MKVYEYGPDGEVLYKDTNWYSRESMQRDWPAEKVLAALLTHLGLDVRSVRGIGTAGQTVHRIQFVAKQETKRPPVPKGK